MENLQPLIDALGGGLSAIVMLGMGFALLEERKATKEERDRSNGLADKIITMSSDTTRVLVDLAHKIDAALGRKQ